MSKKADPPPVEGILLPKDEGDTLQCVSAEEVGKWLLSLPKGTAVYLETSHEIDIAAGCIYYPRQNIVSLVGQSTEIDIDEEDWETCVLFGDVKLWGEDDGEDESPVENPEKDTKEEDGYAEVELPPPTRTARGEVDAPIRPPS